jgi:hypothetical protein
MRRRSLSVIWIVLVSACGPNDGPVPGGESKAKDYITLTDTTAKGPAAELPGSKVLLDAARAYASLQSFVGTVRVESAANYAAGPYQETRTLKVYYQRPGKIRLEGLVPNSGPFLIVSDGQTTRVSGFGIAGTRATVRDALAEFGGVSIRSTVMLPGTLLDTQWNRENFLLPYGAYLPAFATKADPAGEETVGGYRCDRVVCPREIGTWTFFVDREKRLIRRLIEETSEEQMRVQKRLGGGGFTGRIQSTRYVQSFEVEQVNVKLDDAMFARP